MCEANKHEYELAEREFNLTKTRVVSAVLFCPKCGDLVRKELYDHSVERRKPESVRYNRGW